MLHELTMNRIRLALCIQSEFLPFYVPVDKKKYLQDRPYTYKE